ncbi:MAG: ferritin-like domain-containing protein [Nitrospinae bacterium]|nr:ferritin-like domain-containing protein [Nitrospinota bacterium]
MPITKKQLIAKLNKDLEWEYAAAIQYIQHSAAISGPKYKAIEAELLVHANEEIAHAISISSQIDYLGGVPTVKVEKIETSPEGKKMLQQDLKGERNAIKSYRQRISEAESLKEYGLRRALEDILIQEEEHERDIATMLDEG